MIRLSTITYLAVEILYRGYTRRDRGLRDKLIKIKTSVLSSLDGSHQPK